MTQKKDVGKKKPPTKKAAVPKKETPVTAPAAPVTREERKAITWDRRNLLLAIESLTDREILVLKTILSVHAREMIGKYQEYPPKLVYDGIDIYPTDFQELGISLNTYLNPTPITEQDRPSNFSLPNYK